MQMTDAESVREVMLKGGREVKKKGAIDGTVAFVTNATNKL